MHNPSLQRQKLNLPVLVRTEYKNSLRLWGLNATSMVRRWAVGGQCQSCKVRWAEINIPKCPLPNCHLTRLKKAIPNQAASDGLGADVEAAKCVYLWSCK